MKVPKQSLLIIYSILIMPFSLSSYAQQWEFANGPYEGEVHKFAFDPDQTNIIYVSVANGNGLYKSTDEGKTWYDIGPERESGSLQPTVAVDPANPSTVYFGFEKHGVLNKSTDGGSTWQQKFLLRDSVRNEIRSIAIDPSDPYIIYVGLNREANKTIWKSSDGGETWNIKTSGIAKIDSLTDTHSTSAIKINPLNTSILFADVSPDGLYRSDNAAQSWRYIGFGGAFVRDIEILPWDTAAVLVATSSGLFKSSAGGMTWYSTFPDSDTRCLEIDASANILYLGTRGNGAYKSTDNGESWILINNPGLPISMSMAMDVFDIAVNPQQSNHLHLGTGIGPYKSTDGGNNWLQSFDGMRNFYAYDIKISPSNPSIIYTAGRHGVHRSTDHGTMWKYTGGLGTFNGITVDPVDPDIVYGSIVGLDLWNYIIRTTNGGKEWIDVTPYPPSPTFIPFIEIDGSSQRVVYTATYDQFLRSFDYGITWQYIQAPITPLTLAIANDNPDLLYISSREGVFKSTDKGQAWDSLEFSTFGNNTSVYLDPINSETLFITVYGNGIFKSTNGGIDWIKKNDGLPNNIYLTPFLINPQNNQEIFVVSDMGIFQTKNGGNNWNLFEPSPPSPIVYTLAIDTSLKKCLFTGSNQFRGVYMLDLITKVEEKDNQQLPHSIELFQNYPNPFNPSTVIDFRLTQSANVTIEIFDLLGRKIITLLNNYLQGGLNSIVWHGTNEDGRIMPSGVYIYRLTADAYHESKKMVIIH